MRTRIRIWNNRRADGFGRQLERNIRRKNAKSEARRLLFKQSMKGVFEIEHAAIEGMELLGKAI
jgi:hypothetical protein